MRKVVVWKIASLFKSHLQITIYHDKPFEEILSRGIAGLFRVDDGSDINKLYGNDTFVRLAQLWREYGGLSGVQLLSGHIVSTDKRKLNDQEGNYGKIVTNFRWLKDEELHGVNSVFGYGPNITAGIHYTAFTSEGIRYCPFMKQQLLAKGVKFVQKKLASVDDLAEEGHPIVVNCGGFNGGELAGDDAGNMIPIRGVLLKMDASWHKHFLYLDYTTITIPTIDTVYVGTVKQEGVDGPMHILPEDVEDVWRRYEPIQPALRRARQIGHFVGIRPGRKQIRVEAEDRTTKSGKKYRLVHNYGHGGNGFTLAYGSGLHAAHLALGVKTDRYDGIVPSPLLKDPVKKTWKKAEEFYKEGLNLKSG
ncbi:hypothetical protein WR25_21115 isoform B [Diploscapter pachys]|uniref:FAD dependent oxidoreductase domain-containing protein n=1 Tax=Diploscapter pachys TaxID=2018661 RepID=A0A2A2KTN8_9BILA|nr:hypothetical protein WR25_21115 isoform A [Diploscapter pachys]PAV77313.1 hypothetical protein WR25_21115 isoform B [Diploscapter pachys]